jgi:hypothetical protein
MLHCIYCGERMNDIVEKVLKKAGKEVGLETRERIKNYLNLLASAGKTERQLERFGAAYLKEIFEPNSRYSGW